MLQEKYFLAASGLPLVSSSQNLHGSLKLCLLLTKQQSIHPQLLCIRGNKKLSTTLRLHSNFSICHLTQCSQSSIVPIRFIQACRLSVCHLPTTAIAASFNQIQRDRIEVVPKHVEMFGGGFLFVCFWYCIFSPLIVWKPMGTLRKFCLQCNLQRVLLFEN